MSASLLVDLFNTCQVGVSINPPPLLSGAFSAPSSGAIIGQVINMANADTYCNLFACGTSASGLLRLQVQCSDSTASGTFTDPTSGLAQLPGAFSSGAILWVNSGGDNGLLSPVVSGQ